MTKNSLIGLLFLWLFGSCTKPWYCGEVAGVRSSALVITPFDKASGKYLYSDIESRSLFPKDSLQVVDEDGMIYTRTSFLLKQDPRNSLERIYAIQVSPAFRIPLDNEAFEREKTRSIYLKYTTTTIDTLTLVFKAYRDKCDIGQYEYLKIYYRNQLIHNYEDHHQTDFTLNR